MASPSGRGTEPRYQCMPLLLQRPFRSAKTLSDNLEGKCKDADKYYKYVLQATRILTKIQYGAM